MQSNPLMLLHEAKMRGFNYPISRAPPYLIGNIVGFKYLASKNKKANVVYEVKDEFGERFKKSVENL